MNEIVTMRTSGSRRAFGLIPILGLLLAVWGQTPAQASNLVLNGDFEALAAGSTVASPGGYICSTSSPAACVSNLANWSSTCAVGGCVGTNTVASILYPDTNGSAFNSIFGLAGTVANSPTGGKFLAIDGDPQYRASISQSISGLTVGASYLLTFYMAAGQQNGLQGDTTEWWDVTFGSQTTRSTVLSTPEQTFNPWISQSMTFTAAATTQTLTFLSGGTPNGLPPVSLLDGVELNDTATPEPGTLGMLGCGILALAAAKKLRRGAK